MDFSKIIIYKIEHNENKELVYVGSTINFVQRKHLHKQALNPNNKNYNAKVYRMIRENGGWESFQMLIIKKFPCKDKNEARAEEERCRIELRANMNTNRCIGNTKEEEQERLKKYRLENTEYVFEVGKKYREENQERIKETKRQYQIKNSEQLAQKSKEWREAHNSPEEKEAITKYKKEWHEKNKEKIRARNSQKITCECGVVYTLCNKARHYKSHPIL